jgi:hypothetical protein
VKLFADEDDEHVLPYLGDLTKEEFLTIVSWIAVDGKGRDLHIQGRVQLYQHLMQIVIECLLGWNSKTQTVNLGINKERQY